MDTYLFHKPEWTGDLYANLCKGVHFDQRCHFDFLIAVGILLRCFCCFFVGVSLWQQANVGCHCFNVSSFVDMILTFLECGRLFEDIWLCCGHVDDVVFSSSGIWPWYFGGLVFFVVILKSSK